MATLAAERNVNGEELTAEELVKEEVFKQAYIPQRLDEVCLHFFPWWSSFCLIIFLCVCKGCVLRKRYPASKSRREEGTHLQYSDWYQG